MKTILIAEDFQTSRRVIVNTLTKSGYRTLEAGDGVEALEQFDGRTIDLLITDYNMPNMDGAELVESVRKMEKYKYMPVLVLSTEINQAKKDRAHAARITGWITKPFDLQRFLKIIERSLK